VASGTNTEYEGGRPRKVYPLRSRQASYLFEGVSAEAVRTELEKVLGSGLFENAHRLSRFLRFVVDTTLAGGAEGIKEYLIGVEVFGDPEFNSSTDARVRVQAGNFAGQIGRILSHRRPGRPRDNRTAERNLRSEIR